MPQCHTGCMGMTVGGVRGHKRQEIANTVNIISLFWSIREVFVMATRSIGADGAEWDTDHKIFHSAATSRHFAKLAAQVFFCSF